MLVNGLIDPWIRSGGKGITVGHNPKANLLAVDEGQADTTIKRLAFPLSAKFDFLPAIRCAGMLHACRIRPRLTRTIFERRRQ